MQRSHKVTSISIPDKVEPCHKKTNLIAGFFNDYFRGKSSKIIIKQEAGSFL